MNFRQWMSGKLSNRQPCRIVENMTCRPLEDDRYCRKCFDDETTDTEDSNTKNLSGNEKFIDRKF